MDIKWLDWAKELQATAQAGLAYSKDKYDIERFEQIREVAVDMMHEHTNEDKRVIRELFANETGYATPKVDVRAIIFDEQDRLLFVKEEADGKWTPPGGWADIGISPSETAVKEVSEEAGLEVEAVKLIGIADKKCHPHPPAPHHIYKLFIECRIIGGELQAGMETEGAAFFAAEELPELSSGRITESQLNIVFDHKQNPEQAAYFD